MQSAPRAGSLGCPLSSPGADLCDIDRGSVQKCEAGNIPGLASPVADQPLGARFFVYGGVSMAIFINGVVQELLRLVRANGGDITGQICQVGSITFVINCKSSIAGAVREESQERSNLDQPAAR